MNNPSKPAENTLEAQFSLLLHKKLMDKTGANKRQLKKYYTDQYKKTGLLPKSLQLVEKGIFDGRKCSGRKSVLPSKVVQRFKEMVKASANKEDNRFIFITQPARIIKSYQHWLEDEFDCSLSFQALVRCAERENLNYYLKKPDDEKKQTVPTYFNPVKVFELIQVDGCTFHYIKIKESNGNWKSPKVIEFFDTESRQMICLNIYFSESNETSVKQFSEFLLATPFPQKKIRIRPDRAKAFINLLGPIREINRKYSRPNLFYLDPNFAGSYSPKHKVHLETSHRTLHNYEILIIKRFENKIIKTETDYHYFNNKKSLVTVTYIDISLADIMKSNLLEDYRKAHNEKSHRFSRKGITQSWIPQEKFTASLAQYKTIHFDPKNVQNMMRYGFKKIKASVSKKGTINHNKQTFTVVEGREKFSRQQSTDVKVSHYNGKLLIFENKAAGIWLGDALPQAYSKVPEHITKKANKREQMNEVEQIAVYLEDKGFHIDMTILIEKYKQGLTLSKSEIIYGENHQRYERYSQRILTDKQSAGLAMFNAFIMDCDRCQHLNEATPYARFQEE
jgi:hypothetical protein